MTIPKPKSLSRLLAIILFTFYGCIVAIPASSQLSSVNCVQPLSFGAFSQGNLGGTISISTEGFRTVTGSVIPLGLGVNYCPAIFEIEAPEGTVISVMNGSNTTLVGSNGGSMLLQVGTSTPQSPFAVSISPPGTTRVTVGGTLTIGSAAQNPPGNYSGSFSITFNNE